MLPHVGKDECFHLPLALQELGGYGQVGGRNSGIGVNLDGMAIIVKAEYGLEPEDTTLRAEEVALEAVILLDGCRVAGQKVNQEENGIVFIGHIKTATAASRFECTV